MVLEDAQAQGDLGNALNDFPDVHHGLPPPQIGVTCATVLSGTLMLIDIVTAELGVSEGGQG